MTDGKKGTCPACGVRLPLTRHGVIAGHSVLTRTHEPYMAKTCAGTGAAPVGAEALGRLMERARLIVGPRPAELTVKALEAHDAKVDLVFAELVSTYNRGFRDGKASQGEPEKEP